MKYDKNKVSPRPWIIMKSDGPMYADSVPPKGIPIIQCENWQQGERDFYHAVHCVNLEATLRSRVEIFNTLLIDELGDSFMEWIDDHPELIDWDDIREEYERDAGDDAYEYVEGDTSIKAPEEDWDDFVRAYWDEMDRDEKMDWMIYWYEKEFIRKAREESK